jgi:competence protein ComEC
VLPLLWSRGGAELQPGQWRATMLDVGQGLSVVVQTAGHTLVFDTGPRFGPRFDAAGAAVIPALRHLGVRRLDALVVSHGDNDHAGAFDSLTAAYPPRILWSGDPALAAGAGGRPCKEGVEWAWDGVRFRFVHPPLGWAAGENDAACVLHVRGTQGALLLASDVERAAELRLARVEGLAADVLQVPHHGSETSSAVEFLEAVRPRIALVSVGYRNRWGFPRPVVLERYARAGIAVLDTAAGGAVTVGPGPHGRPAVLRRERLDARRYWTTLP